MTTLEELDGFVELVDGDTAHVTLRAANGDTLVGEYPASELLARGIREHRRFKCRTIDTGSEVTIELTPVPDREVTAERQREIEDEIRQALGDGSDN